MSLRRTSGHVSEADKYRMVLQQMPHHQGQALLRRQLDQFPAVIFIQDQGFFHVHVLAGPKDFPGQVVMGLGRGGDDHPLDIISSQHVGYGQASLHARIFFPEFSQNGFIVIADKAQRAQAVIVAHQVLAPVA